MARSNIKTKGGLVVAVVLLVAGLVIDNNLTEECVARGNNYKACAGIE